MTLAVSFSTSDKSVFCLGFPLSACYPPEMALYLFYSSSYCSRREEKGTALLPRQQCPKSAGCPVLCRGAPATTHLRLRGGAGGASLSHQSFSPGLALRGRCAPLTRQQRGRAERPAAAPTLRRARAAGLRRSGQRPTGAFGGAPFAASRAVTATPRVPRSHLSSLCQPWSPSSKSRNRYRGGSGGTSLSRSTILLGGGEHPPPPPLPCGGAVTPHPPNRAGGKAQRGRRDGSGAEQSPPAARGRCAHQGVRSARRSRLPAAVGSAPRPGARAAVNGPRLRVPVPGEPSAGGGGLGGARPPAHSPGTSARAPRLTTKSRSALCKWCLEPPRAGEPMAGAAISILE